MARASSKRHCIELKSYDRFFPNQDTMPKGGFGNLIALPLQKNPRKLGNSVFVDDNFIQYTEQWEFLANIKRLNAFDVSNIIKKHIGSVQTDHSDDNLDLVIAEKAIKTKDARPAKFYGTVKVSIGSQISFSIERMTSKLINALKLTATFANPEFFELQRLRFSTWKTPRFIFCGELQENSELQLPRGVLDPVLQILNEAEGNTRPYILATGSLIGEGFDLPALDTLFITMPISFKGKLIQYAGRLHRKYESKKDVLIYDYLDSSLPLTLSMFKKRLATYKKLKYEVLRTADLFNNHI